VPSYATHQEWKRVRGKAIKGTSLREEDGSEKTEGIFAIGAMGPRRVEDSVDGLATGKRQKSALLSGV